MNFKSQVLDSRPALPFIGCVALARHLSGIKDDFQDHVNSLYKGCVGQKYVK